MSKTGQPEDILGSRHENKKWENTLSVPLPDFVILTQELLVKGGKKNLLHPFILIGSLSISEHCSAAV